MGLRLAKARVIICLMEVSVLFDAGFTKLLSREWLKNIAEMVLSAENRPGAALNIVITGQEKMRRLNKMYLGRDKPTDVLSFSLCGSAEGIPFPTPEEDAERLGDVIISYPQAEVQAIEHHHSVQKEVAILLIHGSLHLLGYDHDTPEAKRRMKKRETAILKLVAERLS